MSQIVFGLIRDCGDGSSCMDWYTDEKLVDKLLLQEEYFQNEGGPAEILTFPDDFDLESAGFRRLNETDE